jgi:hypothetical protein
VHGLAVAAALTGTSSLRDVVGTLLCTARRGRAGDGFALRPSAYRSMGLPAIDLPVANAMNESRMDVLCIAAAFKISR